MKKGIQLILLILAVLALPLSADERERHQSYISYDDGGTVVRTGDDNREIEAHRNLPVYPGDEVITGRRGRAEVHLSDGNILALDRETAVRLRSILDSYEGEDDETVVELRSGKIAVHRTDIGRDVVRLDTNNASYVANHEAVYSVESDARGRDRITVFTGNVEVRTPQRATRLRAGESANVDDRGAYDLAGDQRNSADDFERWFLRRAERFGTYTSKYMDRRLSYWNDDLDDHGRWVFITGIGWTWRPYVSTGWRPYHNGYWLTRNGCLTWVSYDPWAWGTYHYGRWAYDPFHGWIWVPGYGYSPAWVYWWYGSNYVGWAPRGYWDCHRGYYDWAYRPYRRSSIGFGFYGRVRVSDMDLRPWVFVDSNTLITNRIDRAALTTDAIKSRFGRNRDGFATISDNPGRFTREELRDPAASIRRRSLGGDHGIESGTPADLTPYFRRDPNVSSTVRDRITRARGGSLTGTAGNTSTPTQTGSVAPIGRGNVAPIGGGSVAPIGGGNSGNVAGGGSGSTDSRRGGTTDGGGRINRGGSSGSGDSGSSSGSWRGRGGSADDGGSSSGGTSSGGIGRREANPPASGTDGGSTSRGADWRRRQRSDNPAPAPAAGASTDDRGDSSSDVPRRVIDRIGGARVVPRDDDSGSAEANRGSGGSDRSWRNRGGDSGSDSGSSSSGSSSSAGSGSRDRSSSRGGDDSGSRSSAGRDRSAGRGSSGSSSGGSSSSAGSDRRSSGGNSGGSSGGGSSARSNDGGGSGRSSGGNSSGGGNREGGGRIKRD